MAWQMAAAMAAPAVLGALAGGQKQNTTTEYTKQIAPESAFEQQLMKSMGGGFTDYQDLVNAGPGVQDVNASNESARALAALLGQYSQGGFLPTAADQQQAQQFTNQMFAPEQMALQQRFQDAQMYGNRQAARMGRAANDPILANKLLQEQTRQQQMLGANMTQFYAQQAQQMPMQRLNFQQQLAQVQGGLASQAMANRQALLSMGNQLNSTEKNFRVGTASTTVNQSSGGGLMGALTGGLAAAGTGAKLYGALSSGGQQQAVQPTAMAGQSYSNYGNYA